MDLFSVVTPEDAVSKILKALEVPDPARERVPLLDALDRVLACPIVSPEDVPNYPKSTVDGYAVMARDTFGASEALPAILTVTGEVFMGRPAGVLVGPGIAVRVPTGGMLPGGADAVVMVEQAEDIGDSSIGVVKGVAPGENVVTAGQDIKKEATVLEAGKRLGPADLAGLAGLGMEEVHVFRKPRVAILSTGDEVVPVGQRPGPGQVRDMNSTGLAAMAVRDGSEVTLMGIVEDNLDALRSAMASSLDSWDILLISGGSSVGARDLTREVIDSLGPPGVMVHGIALKPGKPAILGLSGMKPIYGLPGHPASALVAYAAVVRPVLLRLAGERNPRHRLAEVTAILSRSISSPVGRMDMVRVALSQEGPGPVASPVLGASALISPLMKADGYIVIPVGKNGCSAGEEVKVILGGP
ncbi:MAG: gephyrin-like molybdotransferase Glp [Bacillota bacterium]